MKISIITINWNNAAGLERTIKSVTEQTYNNIEYIVIDGGSTDGSVDVIKKFADKISYWISEPDKGIYNAMNKGVDVATGDYCLFLNSGDKLLTPLSLEKVICYKKLDSDIISCDLFTDLNSRRNYRKAPRTCPTKLYMMIYNPIPHPSTLIRTSVIKEIKYNENSKVAGDWMFFFTCLTLKNATYDYIPLPLSLFYTDGISSTNGNPKGRLEGIEYLEQFIHPTIVQELKKQPTIKEYQLANSSLTLSKFNFKILYTTFVYLSKIENIIIKPLRSICKNIMYKHSK